MDAYEKVEIARNPKRKTSLDYIEKIFDEFIELHGDRQFKDDKAIICGLAKIDNTPFTIIAEQKGRTTKENIERNFGMPNPESYRKGIRFMKQAEKFHRPVITFIDTKGAYPGIGAEERGQGEAIASSMLEMASLTVPTISIIIGEGSSGGALALGLGNKVLMLENAIYSILSPEGYASILWKDASRAKEAAEKMKLTAKDLKEMNVIDEIIKEPEIEESEACEVVSQNLKNEILSDWYILRARGKAAIIPLIKYLKAMYIDIYIMHDKDENTPGAVVFNEPIRQALDNDSHLFVLENCVEDMLGYTAPTSDKPYKAYCYINKNWGEWKNIREEWKTIIQNIFNEGKIIE